MSWCSRVEEGEPCIEPGRIELRRGSGLQMLLGKERAPICSHNKEKSPTLFLTPFKPNDSSLKQWGT